MIPEKNKNKIDKNTSKRLSVQVSLNGLSFLIKDTNLSRVVFYKNIPFATALNPEEVLGEIQKAYNTFDLLNEPVKEINVIHQNLLFALVPKAVFNEEQPECYLNFNTKLLPTDYVAFDVMEALDIVNVYVPLTNVNNYFFDLYGPFTFRHTASVYIERILSKERNSDEIKMFAHLYKNQMDVLVAKGKKIQLFNSFYHSTPEDFIYYILFIAEQLTLNPEVVPLQLSGAVSKTGPYFEIAYTYVRNVTVFSDETIENLKDVPQGVLLTQDSLLFQL